MGEKTKKPVKSTGGNLFNFDTSLLPEGVASQVEHKRNGFTNDRREWLHKQVAIGNPVKSGFAA